MNKSRLLVVFFIISLINVSAATAANHHSGHGGGSGGGSEGSCIKPELTKFLPPHLADAMPGSAFSFMAFNVSKPEQITVTVKEIPVKLTFEDKESFYLVKGKLPESLNNTVARINITVNTKIRSCDAENGWLVKISDK